MATTRRATERKTEQRPNLTPRMRSYDGIYANSFRYPPYSLDKLLQQKGWDVPEDMLTMSACRSPFNLKRYSILADGWKIVPAITDPYDSRNEKAKRFADATRWAFSNIVSPAGLEQDFRTVIFETLRACWDGFRVAEQGYRYLEEGEYAGLLGYDGFYHKHARQIGFDLDQRTSQILHITSYTPGGVVYSPARGAEMSPGGYDFDVPVDNCILYTCNPDAGLPFGSGDWRGCYKHWWALDNIARFWTKSLERWGGPVFLAWGPEASLSTVAQTLDNIRDGASAALPDNVKAEIAQAAVGVFEGYRLAAMWHEQQIAKNIHQNTLSTSEGEHGGNRALGQTHENTAETIYDYIARDVEGVFNTQVIKRLCTYNFADFDADLCPRLVLRPQESKDVFSLMQAFDLAIKDGVVSKRATFIRQQLGWPPLDPDEEKMLEEEQQAEQEAQERMADLKNSNRLNAVNDLENQKALEIIYRMVVAKLEQERQSA